MANLTPRAAVEQKIGDTVYRVRPLGAKKGCAVLTKLTKLIGTAAGKTVGGRVNVIDLIAGALEDLSEENLAFFVDTFADYTDIEHNGNWPGLKGVMELQFSANYGDMFEWLKFCLELNYGSLFTRVSAALTQKKADNLETKASS